MSKSALIVFLLLAAPAVHTRAKDECPEHYLDKAVLNDLATASSVAGLDHRWSRIPAHDPIDRIVYASRRVALSPSRASDDLLIDAIPRDSMTLDLLYNLCYEQSDGASRELQKIAGGSWIDSSLAAVLRQHRGYERILMLPYVGRHNADIGETIPCTISDLKDQAPQEYTRALRALRPEARALVCPDCCE